MDEQSATLSIPTERKLAINADHIHLCRFNDPEDPSLSEIVKVIEYFRQTRPKPIHSPQLRTFYSDPSPKHYNKAQRPLSRTLPLPPTVSAAVRVTNIEISTTENDLQSYFESRGLPLSPDQKFTFVKREEDYKSTTVSFINKETCQRALTLSREDRRLKNRVVEFDGDFNGFTVLFEGAQCQVECVYPCAYIFSFADAQPAL